MTTFQRECGLEDGEKGEHQSEGEEEGEEDDGDEAECRVRQLDSSLVIFSSSPLLT